MHFVRRSLLALLLLSAPGYLPSAIAQERPTAVTQPTLLVNIDHRATLDLGGDWHYLVDPYQTGLYNFHHEIKKEGFFLALEAPTTPNGLLEYDFAKSPTLKVPGDWNTQQRSLYYYEGMLWYQRDFDYTPKAGNRAFFHIGAANYRSSVFVNGKHICDHEGGFTPFDCEVTGVLHSVATSPSSRSTTPALRTGFPRSRRIGGTMADSRVMSPSSMFRAASSTTTICISAGPTARLSKAMSMSSTPRPAKGCGFASRS